MKNLKGRQNRKEGRGNKDFKKGRQAGSRGALKSVVGGGGRGWDPLMNYLKKKEIFVNHTRNCFQCHFVCADLILSKRELRKNFLINHKLMPR